MSETIPTKPSDWVLQGFEAPFPMAQARKQELEALVTAGKVPVEIGSWLPPFGAPPFMWTKDKNPLTGKAMFAIATRRDAPLACPAGMTEADTDLVGRLANG